MLAPTLTSWPRPGKQRPLACCACRRVASCEAADCAGRYPMDRRRRSLSTCSARNRPRSRGRPGGCVGRTSGCPLTAPRRERCSRKRGVGPRVNGLSWLVTVGVDVPARPSPALLFSTECQLGTLLPTCASTTTRTPWRRHGSAAMWAASPGGNERSRAPCHRRPRGDGGTGTLPGTICGMATRKVTLSIDLTAWALAEAAAARAGISPSAWLSAAARREAVRLGAGTDWGDPEAEALAQDADLAAAEADLRAAG